MAFLDFLFNPIITNLDPTPSNPVLTIFLVAIIISLITTICQKLFIDYDRMYEIQAQTKEIQQEMNAARKAGDPKALAKATQKQREFAPLQMELMRMQLRPSIITIVPIIIIYRGMIANHVISHVVVDIASTQYYLIAMPIWNIFWKQSDPLTINFFGWYILCVFTIGFVLRRIFGIRTSV